MNIKKLVLFFGLFFAVAVIFIFPAAAKASHVNCGDTITTSTTLDSNLNCNGNGLIIGANNITLDCNGFTIQGSLSGMFTGIKIFGGKQYVTVKNCNISGFYYGISLFDFASAKNIFTNNTVSSNSYGILLQNAVNNVLTSNTVTSNAQFGIYLAGSPSNNLFNNTITSNASGISLFSSGLNMVFHNNIINNSQQAFDDGANFWDVSNEGNYWSNFDTAQEGCYDNDNNGICDDPLVILGGDNKDNFPFINPNGWGWGAALNEYSIDPFTDALYHLDEGSGSTAVDAMGKHNGTLQKVGTNFPAWTGNTAPLTGSTYAMEFDGNKGYVDVSNGLLDNPSAFTIETWFNLQGMPKVISDCGGVDCFMLLSKNTDNNLTSLFQLFYESTNVIGINVYSGGNLYRADYTFTNQILNEWHHVAATYDGSVLKLFVDGIQVDSVSVPTALNNVTSSFFIGRDGRTDDPNRVLKGYLDEIRISNYARHPCQFNVGFTVCPPPVLLVHGIYGDDTTWGQQIESSLEGAGYQVFKVGEVLNQKGLYPNNADIKILAGQVQQAIQNIKATGVSKVNVVAHSMGGLATRWYVGNAGYQNDIDKLITLGTPNEGAPIARSLVAVVFGGLIGDSILDIAKAQMIPGSNFLNALNSNFSTQGVTHTEVAGTDTNNVALAATLTAINLLPFPYNIIFQLGFPYSYFFTVNDTIVPAASVNIPNINCYEHLNVHTDALDFLNSPAYYDDPAVISEIIAVLNGSQTTFPQCVEVSTQSGTNTQNLNVSDSVNPGEIKTIVNQGLGTEFKSSLMWQGGILSQEFVSPTGVTVNASNYQSYGGVNYSTGSFSGSNYEFFEFNTPEQGTWTVKVIGINITAATTFNLNVAFTDNVNVDFYTDKTNYAPNETVILRTQLTDSSGPVLNAGVEVLIVDPNGADTTINLRDDGLSNDVLANDGIYGNVFSGTVLEGTYNAGITATTTQFQINDGDAFFVDLQPDLSIQSQDISFNPSVLSKTEDNNVSVSATIYNIGDEDVSGAEIDFYDGDPASGGKLFATTSVSVLAGGSAQTQANLFVPKQKFSSGGAGKASGTLIKDHDIHVIISSYSGFIEKDYSNNQASKLLKYGR